MLKRCIIHWTAGGSRASDVDKKHYHWLVEHDGEIVKGTERVEDNIVTSDGDYAAHTRNLNTSSIGIAMCGMRQAVEHPFDPGPSPLTEKQFRACAILVAEMCRQYSIPVTPRTVLTHAEVEPTLGVKQRGKWDITHLPFRRDIVGAIPVGDYFREIVRAILGEETASTRPTIKVGGEAQREDVTVLQKDLTSLGYAVGRVDGIFGNLTRRAVLAFQADNGLVTDGIVGPATWVAMTRAVRPPERRHTEASLRGDGSQTIAQADSAQRQAKTAGASVGALSAVQTALSFGDQLQDAQGMLDAAQSTLLANWPVLLVLGIGAIIYFKGPQILQVLKDIRVRDAVQGKHLGR